MPYSKSEPPERIKSLPDKAQEIWIAAFNAAFKEYKDDDEAANKVAWAAVKKKYKKEGDAWVARANECMTHINASLSPKVREETLEGRAYLVAPAIALVEGVHAGSQGPAYYPPDELARNIQAWNGIPIPINHPKRGDEHISCNAPDVLEAANVGRFFNAFYDSGKVKGEIWIDIEKCGLLAPQVLESLRAGRLLETSSGLWSDDEYTAGEWNGESYTAIVRNIIPDHFALLPNGKGACSCADGCGTPRVNEQQEDKKMAGEMSTLKKWLHQAMNVITRNEMSHETVRDKIYAALRAKVNLDNTYLWLMEVFDKECVYSVEPTSGGKTSLFKQGYEIDKDEKVTLAGVPVEVKEVKSYIALQSMGGEERMLKDRVDTLIANGGTHFEEGDREWLMGLTECQLAKLEPKAAEPKANAEPEPTKAPEPEPKVNDEPPKPITFEELLSKADPDTRDMITNGIAVTKEQKDKLIADLKANKHNTFKECELKAKSLDELKKLASLARVEVDYAPQGGAPKANAEEEQYADDMPLPDFSKK